jgi:hypothetical protein
MRAPCTRRRALPAILGLLLCSSCSRVEGLFVAPADAGPEAIEAAICASRPGCWTEKPIPLAPGADRRERFAVVARVRKPPVSSIDDVGPVASRLSSGGKRGSRRSVDAACVYSETWLVSRADVHVRAEQLLGVGCSPPEVEVLASGDVGVTRRWAPDLDNQPPPPAEYFDFALDPPRIRKVTVGGSLWDWDSFRGDECDIRARSGFDPRPECRPIVPAAQVADDGSFARGGWQTTGLGSCSLLIGDPTKGASMRLLLSDRVLYVEINDDAFVTKGSAVDGLRLWKSFPEAKPGEVGWTETGSLDGRWMGRDRRQRLVRVADVSPTVRRFAIDGALPDAMGEMLWELAYEDTSDGRTLRSTVDTRQPGTAAGQPVLSMSPEAVCTPRNGVLEPVHPGSRGRDAPLTP